MLSPLKNAALVTSIAFGAVVMLTGGASAESFGTRCVGDHCYAVHCNNYGEHCRRVEPYERDYYRRVYYDPNYRVVCEAGSDRCWKDYHYTRVVREPVYDYDDDYVR
jgi:hypothetical protein